MSWTPDLSTLDTATWRRSGDPTFHNGGIAWRPFAPDRAAPVEVTRMPREDGATKDEQAWTIRWAGTIYLHPEDRQSVLETCSYAPHAEGVVDVHGQVVTGEEALTLLVEAAWGYGSLDDWGYADTFTRADLREMGKSLVDLVEEGIAASSQPAPAADDALSP